MHPPRSAIEALERLHPHARLGWYGQERGEGDDELNKGEFVLLQLYRQRQSEEFLYEPWRERGPVFGSDYDKLEWEPLWLANFSKEEVFGGSFIDKVRRWMRPMKERIRESALERGRDLDSQISDITSEYGEKLYHAAMKSTEKAPILAKKFHTEEDKEVLTGDLAAKRSVERSFLPRDAQGRELV